MPFRLDLIGPTAASSVVARALILCPGTTERVVPFPGWTLPGVIGLAGTTALLKAQGVLPGRRVVVAGRGPLLAAVAAGVLHLGGRVVAVVDAAPRAAWLGAMPALASRPALLARGVGWLAAIAAARVPVLSGWRVAAAEGETEIRAVDIAPVNAAAGSGAARHLECDALCVGDGLVPATEAATVLGAPHLFDRARGGWVPRLDPGQRTGIAGLYVAGDGAGVRGTAVAPLTGRLAALSALRDLGPLRDLGQPPPDTAARAAALRREADGASRFGAAMAAMTAPRAVDYAPIPPGCVVCRCEDVTRAEIDEAIDLGARDLNQVKHFTRCGMGPCQGRMCGEATAELLGLRVDGREPAGRFTARLPLRPVPLAALLGEFDYADIPLPAPAPI